MALSKHQVSKVVRHLKGYEHQFVDQSPDDLLCLICLSVARNPQQISCCGKVFCKGCLLEHKKHSGGRTLCPQCRKVFQSFADKRSKCISVGYGINNLFKHTQYWQSGKKL